MTAVASPSPKAKRTYAASVALRAYILARIRKVAKDQTVVSDATGSPEWPALVSLDTLNNAMDAEIVRDALIAAIVRGLTDPRHFCVNGPHIRVAYARILAMLNDYLWIAKHPEERDQWPPRDYVGEW